MASQVVDAASAKNNDKNNDDTSKNNNFSTSDMTRRMVCGGLAGMVAKTATNPLERIKMLSQTGEHGMKSTRQHASPSILDMYRQIIQKEGVIGLWAGNGANLLRVFPSKAIVFSSNDMYKSMLCRITGTSKDNPSGAISFLAGGFAGMTASAVTYPLDFARGRISGKLAGSSSSSGSGGQSATTTKTAPATTAKRGRPTKVYSGLITTIALTIKDEGFFALYKGIAPTMIGAMPYEGIKFGTVGLLETFFPTKKDQPASYYVTRKMLMGGVGGVMAGLITYPNDTIRRMLQLQGSRGTTSEFSGYWDCARKTFREHGIKRFYRGIVINTVRMFPNVCIQFGSYELLKRWTVQLF